MRFLRPLNAMLMPCPTARVFVRHACVVLSAVFLIACGTDADLDGPDRQTAELDTSSGDASVTPDPDATPALDTTPTPDVSVHRYYLLSVYSLVGTRCAVGVWHPDFDSGSLRGRPFRC